MESDQADSTVHTECVSDCLGHQIFEGDWKKVTVGGDGETVAVGTYEVGVTGVGGTIAASGSHWHGIVAIASTNGTAFSGDGGVAVSSSKGSHSLVGQCGYAYSKGGKATAGACSVAGTAGGALHRRQKWDKRWLVFEHKRCPCGSGGGWGRHRQHGVLFKNRSRRRPDRDGATS